MLIPEQRGREAGHIGLTTHNIRLNRPAHLHYLLPKLHTWHLCLSEVIIRHHLVFFAISVSNAVRISIPQQIYTRAPHAHHDAPYLGLKYAGGSVASTSTNGRSTTISSPGPRKSTCKIGRYCVTILKLFDCCSSSDTSIFGARSPLLGIKPLSRRRFLDIGPFICSFMVTLHIHVEPQNNARWEFGLAGVVAGSNVTPKIGS